MVILLYFTNVVLLFAPDEHLDSTVLPPGIVVYLLPINRLPRPDKCAHGCEMRTPKEAGRGMMLTGILTVLIVGTLANSVDAGRDHGCYRTPCYPRYDRGYTYGECGGYQGYAGCGGYYGRYGGYGRDGGYYGGYSGYGEYGW